MRPQTFTDVPSTRKPSSLRLRLQAGADEPRPNVCEVQKNHPNPAQPCANSSKRCIKRASISALNLLTFRWSLTAPSAVSDVLDRVVGIAPAPLLPGEKETDYAEAALRIVKAATPN